MVTRHREPSINKQCNAQGGEVERSSSGHGNSSTTSSSSHFEMPFHYGQDQRTRRAKATELSHSIGPRSCRFRTWNLKLEGGRIWSPDPREMGGMPGNKFGVACLALSMQMDLHFGTLYTEIASVCDRPRRVYGPGI